MYSANEEQPVGSGNPNVHNVAHDVIRLCELS